MPKDNPETGDAPPRSPRDLSLTCPVPRRGYRWSTFEAGLKAYTERVMQVVQQVKLTIFMLVGLIVGVCWANNMIGRDSH